MARKCKMSIDFKGFEEYAEKLDELNADLKSVIGQALESSHGYVTANIKKEMRKHHQTGDTEKSIMSDSKVVWDGSTASIDVGFDIANGGLPSIFLMYGTPRHAPGHPGTSADQRLYDAIYGKATKKKLNELQEKTLARAVKRIMGG